MDKITKEINQQLHGNESQKKFKQFQHRCCPQHTVQKDWETAKLFNQKMFDKMSDKEVFDILVWDQAYLCWRSFPNKLMLALRDRIHGARYRWENATSADDCINDTYNLKDIHGNKILEYAAGLEHQNELIEKAARDTKFYKREEIIDNLHPSIQRKYARLGKAAKEEFLDKFESGEYQSSMFFKFEEKKLSSGFIYRVLVPTGKMYQRRFQPNNGVAPTAKFERNMTLEERDAEQQKYKEDLKEHVEKIKSNMEAPKSYDWIEKEEKMKQMKAKLNPIKISAQEYKADKIVTKIAVEQVNSAPIHHHTGFCQGLVKSKIVNSTLPINVQVASSEPIIVEKAISHDLIKEVNEDKIPDIVEFPLTKTKKEKKIAFSFKKQMEEIKPIITLDKQNKFYEVIQEIKNLTQEEQRLNKDLNRKAFAAACEIIQVWDAKYYRKFLKWAEKFNKKYQKKHGQEMYLLRNDNGCLLFHHVLNWQKTYIKDAMSVPNVWAFEQSGGDDVTNLETTSMETSSKNITFEDERPVDNNQTHTSGDTQTMDVHGDISETKWTISEILTREYPLKSLTWKVSQSRDTVIETFPIPGCLFRDVPDSMIVSQLKFFAFLRAGFKLRVQLNGTKFHLGRILVYYEPMHWKESNPTRFVQPVYPNFMLDASVSNSGHLEIPFTHILSHFSQEQNTILRPSVNTLGRVKIIVYNALKCSENAPQEISMQVYGSLMAPELHQPCKPITPAYGDGVLQGLEGTLKRVTGDLVQSGLGIADKMTGGLVTGAGDAICNLLGIQDKPLDPIGSNPIINKTIAPLSHGAGLDRSIRLSLVPTSQTNSTPNTFGAVDSDFNILSLCQIPSLLNTFEWTTAKNEGSKLADYLLSPVYLSHNQYNYIAPNFTAKYDPTILAYIARAFCYWRGTLRYKFQIVKTQFHSGRLAFVYDPHGTRDNNQTVFESNKSLNMVVMDIQEKSEITIDVPYFSVRPWTRCDHFKSDANLKDQSTVSNGSFLDADVTGVLRVYVLNKLVCPDNVSTTTEINCFVSAGNDFQLAVPRPLSPLMLRPSEGTKYDNFPRYPFCKGGAPFCQNNNEIYTWYLAGRALFDRGLIYHTDTDKNWYEATIKIKNQDTMVWKSTMQVLEYMLKDHLDKPCQEYIKSLGKYTGQALRVLEQSKENFTTTRDSNEDTVNILKNKRPSDATPNTLSENAMNLQTVLRRYYPIFFSGTMAHNVEYTVIAVPVSPSFLPPKGAESIMTRISRFFHVNNIAWFSRLFVYWRGSMRYKVVVTADNSEVCIWHDPVEARNFMITSGVKHEHIAERMSYASEMGVTQTQQGYEVEVPYFSAYNQLIHTHQEDQADLRAQNGTLFIAIRNRRTPFNLSIFMSTGDDFFFNVLRAPQTVYEPQVYAYTNENPDKPTESRYPDLQMDMTHISRNFQLPGTGVMNRWDEGNMDTCRLPIGYSEETQDFHKCQQEVKDDLPMHEQMFSISGNVVSAIDEKYGETINKMDNLITKVTDLTEEIQDYTLPQVLGAAKVFHQDINNTHETIKEFIPHMTELFDIMKATGINIQNTGNVMSTAFEHIGEAGHVFALLLKIIYIQSIIDNVILYIKNRHWRHIVNIIISLAALFRQDATKIVQWLLQKVFEYGEKAYTFIQRKVNNDPILENVLDSNCMREQGLDDLITDNIDGVCLVTASIVTVLYVAMFSKLPSWKQVKECAYSFMPKEQGLGLPETLRSLHYSNMGLKGLKQAFDYIYEKVQHVVHYFVGKECKEVMIKREFDELAEEVEKWIDEVAELEDEDFYHLALTDINIHNKFYFLADQGQKFSKWLIRNKTNSAISMVIRDTNKRLNDMIKRINEIRPGHGFRYAPFVVCLHGETSTGKSRMMHTISDLIRENLQIPHYNSIYSVPRDKTFLSGYEGQAIVEWDDMMQSTSQDDLVGDFIQWCSNSECRVDMADLGHKGYQFVSKAIVCSTNVGYLTVNAIRDMDAFRRRRNIMIGVQFKNGWDKEKMKNAPNDPHFRHCVFSILKSDEDIPIRSGMNWEEVLDYISTEHQKWDVKQKEMVDEYFDQHESLRIPRGVVVENEANPTIKIEENLTEEEQIDAELFELEFQDKTLEEKQSIFRRAINKIKTKCINPTNKYWDLIKRKFKIGLQNLQAGIKNLNDRYPNLFKILGYVSGLGAIGAAFFFLWKMFKPEVKEETGYEIGVSKTPVKLIKAENAYDPTNCSKTPKITKAEGLEQGSSDPATIEMARSKIHPLMIWLHWENGANALQGVSIGGKVILCPHHFFRKAKDGEFFYFRRGNDAIQIEFKQERMFRIRDKDAVLYYMGAAFDSRKNIVNCFIQEKNLCKIPTVESILLGTHPNGIIIEKNGKAIGNTKIDYIGKDTNTVTYSQYGWQYNMHTVDGECGSLLIACTNRIQPPGKIIGMHVAGYQGRVGGFSVLLTREMIQEGLDRLIAQFGPQVYSAPLPSQVIQDDKTFEEQCKLIPEGSFSYYGVMDKNYCPSQPRKSAFVPTPFQGEIGPVRYKPAPLKEINGVSPLRKALAKYGKLTKPFSDKNIKIVSDSIKLDLLKLDSDLPAEVIDTDIAVFGVEGMDYIYPINMQSSPGWPYQCLKRCKGKREMFDFENRTIKDEILISNLKQREKLAKEGLKYVSIWRDCMKDELRPVESVEAGKVRLFTIAPVDFTILVRKYFLSFTQAFYKGHSKFFSAVGINAESYEWTEAYNRLRQYGTKCVAGDFSSYDGTLMPELMSEVGEIINTWYEFNGDRNTENHLVRRVLIDEMIHTYQLIHNCVYKTHQGNPSGNPLTVIINTIVNAFYMRLAWMEIMQQKAPQYADMQSYSENVIEEMYGDDNRLVVKDEVIDYFNQISIAEQLAKHNITYTDELKSGQLQKYKELDNTSFLKRTYRVDEEIGKDIKLPCLLPERIICLTNWFRDTEDVEAQLIENQRCAYAFAFFHGRKYFNELKQKLETTLIKFGYTPLKVTYDDHLDKFISDVRGNTKLYRNLLDFGQKGKGVTSTFEEAASNGLVYLDGSPDLKQLGISFSVEDLP